MTPAFTQIRLSDMTFYARHGVHAQEKIRGNVFKADVWVKAELKPEAWWEDELSGTLDYSLIWQVVSEEMDQPAQLLEHLAQRIVSRLKTLPGVIQGEITLRKENPPFGGNCREVSVTFAF
jgi:7,8-dihydroneopterin aldolase/epimerase/oxygenase